MIIFWIASRQDAGDVDCGEDEYFGDGGKIIDVRDAEQLQGEPQS